MKSASTKMPNGHGSVYKEVRFSPTATPARRAQSLSASSSSANLKFLGTRTSANDSYSVLNTYIQQSRSLLESQRALFAQERRLWEEERALLRSRITELESLLNDQGGRVSASGSNSSPPGFHPLTEKSNDNNHHHVWEGSSFVGRPTRVFHETEKADGHLSPFKGQGSSLPPSLDAALSPRTRPADHSTALPTPVPIEKLDSKLDGITLKSTALPPEVVARVITPPSPSPEASSSPVPQQPSKRLSMERKNSLKLKLSDLGPPHENLTRDAGHTPMAIIDGGMDTNQPSANGGTPREENPTALPVTEPQQPVENSDSYFPDLPEDPALKGPLSLLNDEEHDSGFLKELDAKLLDQARRILSNSSNVEDEKDTDTDAESTAEEQEPQLKFKDTTNFGTAFGISNCDLKS